MQKGNEKGRRNAKDRVGLVLMILIRWTVGVMHLHRRTVLSRKLDLEL